MSIVFIDEHKFKRQHVTDWVEKLQNESELADIQVIYGCIEDESSKQTINKLAKSLSKKSRVLLFEECLEKGGGGDGGLIPTVLDILLRGSVITFSIVATSMLSKLGEETYFGIARLFSKFLSNIKAKNSVVVELSNSSYGNYKYYYSKDLTAEQALRGFVLMKKHFLSLDKTANSESYFYVPKINEWQKI